MEGQHAETSTHLRLAGSSVATLEADLQLRRLDKEALDLFEGLLGRLELAARASVCEYGAARERH